LNYISQEFVDKLNLKKDELVLDVGCGIGGSAFYMVKVNIYVSSDSIEFFTWKEIQATILFLSTKMPPLDYGENCH
jgi:cyclopropane fatty-acyl-phospholipid synthase-like methyltransferase